jgi:hypothetical protein
MFAILWIPAFAGMTCSRTEFANSIRNVPPIGLTAFFGLLKPFPKLAWWFDRFSVRTDSATVSRAFPEGSGVCPSSASPGGSLPCRPVCSNGSGSVCRMAWDPGDSVRDV